MAGWSTTTIRTGKAPIAIFQPASYFGPQDPNRPGNTTRFNPRARAPWVKEVNFSLAKSFPIREAIRLDLRWEMFNAFNDSAIPIAGTSPTYRTPTFGQVNSTV